ncbi:5301_t:CDS:2 [Cetraspora pellucida]|uniref:5301_t:CDS:1 n=1 Tax=Cetraspora pellucida TaxID=1433469 RepID=A0ACA9K5U7_9GLOM|nr:5301_t:CDS:2 [Cetraspora pellucida]
MSEVEITLSRKKLMPVNFFHNIVNAISNNSEASQEVQEVAKKLSKRKKDCMILPARRVESHTVFVQYDIKEAISRWKEPMNKHILGDVTNLIPVPVAGEKRRKYDANITDISSKRIKVPVSNATSFEASSNIQYLSPREKNSTYFLCQENALACIPPILKYSLFACESKSTTSVDSKPLKEVLLWEDFLEKANEHLFDQQKMIFKKSQFHYNHPLFSEANVYKAVDTNINSILNELMGTNYDFSSQKSYVGESDFTCYHNDDFIMIVEVKRKHILKKIYERTLSEFYMMIKYMTIW